MTATTWQAIRSPGIANAESRQCRIFVRDLVLSCSIGVHRHEQGVAQSIRINLDLDVDQGPAALDDALANVVCYEAIIDGVRAVVGGGHVNLVETLAERIAAVCLEDRRVRLARVRVEKLDAIADAEGVGVEIERRRPAS